MGSMGNCGRGRAWDCSRKVGIAQGSKGECTGALRLQNAVAVRVSAVVRRGGGELGFDQTAGSRREEEGAMRGCESGFYADVCRGVCGEGDGE